MTESTPAIVPASKKQDFDNPMTDADIHEMWGGDEGRAVEISSREVRLIARIDFEKAEREKAQAEVARLKTYPGFLALSSRGLGYSEEEWIEARRIASNDTMMDNADDAKDMVAYMAQVVWRLPMARAILASRAEGGKR